MPKKVILFDNNCPICCGFVDFVKKRDKKNVFVYKPISGTDHEKQQIEKHGCVYSMVLEKNDTLHYFDEAIILILADLKSPWPTLAKIARWFPKKLRRLAYKLIAKNRLRISKYMSKKATPKR